MNKKLWTILVSVLLIVSMSVCLFACSGSDDSAEQLKSSLKLRNGSVNASGTKGVQIGANSIIAVESTKDITTEEFIANFTFADKDGNAVDVRVDAKDTKHFTIKKVGGFATGWYNLTLLSSNLSFTQYPNTTKLVISVVADADIDAALSEDVIYLAAGSAAIYDFNTTDSGMTTFKFDSTIAGEMIKMGDTVLVQDETGNYAAYKIWGVSATNEDGIYTVAYQIPSYDEVYDEFKASSKATLADGTIEYANYSEAVDAIVNELSAGGFDVGPVHIEANYDKGANQVNVQVKVTVKDVLKEKDSINSLDLILTFDFTSKISATTDINIGALILSQDNSIQIKALFDNTLDFNVTVADGIAVDEVAGLDSIILKIKNLVNPDKKEDALSVPIFNWIVPIGNGVADVSFQVNAVLDLNFEGQIGVDVVAKSQFEAIVNYNPATQKATLDYNNLQAPKPESVEIDLDATTTIYLGIEATITFDLLAGVLSVGIGAEVGNYNRIYGSLHTTNLLEYKEKAEKGEVANYGYYVEGGIYYDVYLIYNLAGIVSGTKSFFEEKGGRQEKELYTAGSRYVVEALYDKDDVFVTTEPQDIVINCSYRDIVTKEEVKEVNIIDATKIKELSEGDGTKDYIQIVNGKISLTQDAIDDGVTLTNYEVVVVADGSCASIFVNSKQVVVANQNELVTGFDIPSGAKEITAYYVGGDAIDVDVEYNKFLGINTSVKSAKFYTAGAGTIIVKAGKDVIAVYKVV